MNQDEVSQDQVIAALDSCIDPNTDKPFTHGRAVKNINIDNTSSGAQISLDVELSYPAASQIAHLRGLILTPLAAMGFVHIHANVYTKIVARAVQPGVKVLPGVKNIIAVASGKGGVGKSTTAVNIALALAAEGAVVGILDADIYGPSQMMMLGLSGRPESTDGKTLQPFRAHGIAAMSIGGLVDVDTPMVWRGPMATQALEQLLNQTNWGDLDYLIVDMPPGTGDIQLTLSQKVPVTGAVIVTTPQDIALLDARKGLKMFEKVNIPILGVVENMAMHVCTQCGHTEHIFGADGGKRMAEQYNVNYLGALPLDITIRESTDAGVPTVAVAPQSELAQIYGAIARKIAVKVAEKAKDFSLKMPSISISKTT